MPKTKRRELTESELERRDVMKTILRLERKYFGDMVDVPRIYPKYKTYQMPTKKEINEMIERLREEVDWYE